MDKKNIAIEKSYWNSFYSKHGVTMPSQFCAFLVSEISNNTSIVEFGCGNGRDALFLARHGYSVHAVDLSKEAIDHNKDLSENLDSMNFIQGDVSIAKDVIKPIESARKHSDKPLVIYSRFFLHSIDSDQERKFMSTLSTILKEGDRLYFEFRSIEDQNTKKTYTNHFRRFIDTQHYLDSLSNDFNFDALYSITGQGMAKFKDEDPFVTRVVAIKK